MRAVIIIDYQNIHLTAHEEFCPAGLAKHESLIHPNYFANQVIHTRTRARLARGMDTSAPAVTLARVAVFRGLPNNRHQSDLHRRVTAQKAEWTGDPRVDVNYRPLRYHRGTDGRWFAQEKGVDVLVALEVVKPPNPDGTTSSSLLATTPISSRLSNTH